jgi:hypothetical protein
MKIIISCLVFLANASAFAEGRALDFVHLRVPTIYSPGVNEKGEGCFVKIGYQYRDEGSVYRVDGIIVSIKENQNQAVYAARYYPLGGGPQCPTIMEESAETLLVKNIQGANCGSRRSRWSFRIDSLENKTRYAVETPAGSVVNCFIPKE